MTLFVQIHDECGGDGVVHVDMPAGDMTCDV